MTLREEAAACAEDNFCGDCNGYCTGDRACEGFRNEVEAIIKEWQEEGENNG